MGITSLSLILALVFGWWLVTVGLTTGAFKPRRHHPRHHDEGGEHQH